MFVSYSLHGAHSLVSELLSILIICSRRRSRCWSVPGGRGSGQGLVVTPPSSITLASPSHVSGCCTFLAATPFDNCRDWSWPSLLPCHPCYKRCSIQWPCQPYGMRFCFGNFLVSFPIIMPKFRLIACRHLPFQVPSLLVAWQCNLFPQFPSPTSRSNTLVVFLRPSLKETSLLLTMLWRFAKALPNCINGLGLMVTSRWLFAVFLVLLMGQFLPNIFVCFSLYLCNFWSFMSFIHFFMYRGVSRRLKRWCLGGVVVRKNA